MRLCYAMSAIALAVVLFQPAPVQVELREQALKGK